MRRIIQPIYKFWIFILFVVLDRLAFLRDNFIPERHRKMFQFLDIFESTPWYWWALIAVSIFAIWTVLYDPIRKKWVWKLTDEDMGIPKGVVKKLDDILQIKLSNGDIITSVLWGFQGNMRPVINEFNQHNVNGTFNFKATVGNLIEVEHGVPDKIGIIKIKGKPDIRFKEYDVIILP